MPIASDVALETRDADGWLEVMSEQDLQQGTTSAIVYFEGKQVALFNVNGSIYALGNRCSHGRGPLGEGRIEHDDEECTVTCPWHYAKFDLSTGHVVDGVATAPVPAYEVEVRHGAIYLREQSTVFEVVNP
jgi:nitrite reductase/ring-hydroxylating ferredoxin subunit